MKMDYEKILESLNENKRLVMAQIPEDLAAKFNDGEQMLETNEEFASAVGEFLSASIVATPHMVRQTVERLARFFANAKLLGKAYFASMAVVDDFNAKFKKASSPQFNAQTAQGAQKQDDGQPAHDAVIILRQALFRNFFAMLPPNRRERLIRFMEERDLCDEVLAKELRTRINDKIDRDERKTEAFMRQVEKGGMNCFLWLHQMIFDFLNGIMESEERNDEMKARFDAELKQRSESKTGPPQVQASSVEAQKYSLEMEQLKNENKRLELEVGNLQNSLRTRDEFLAVKLEAEQAKFTASYEQRISSLTAEKLAVENSCAKLAEEFARKSKFSAHAFESFLDTLPKRYAASGYVMLRSIVNEWDGDLQSIQAKERKYASNLEPEPPQKESSDIGKILIWIVIALLSLALVADIYFRTRQRPIQSAQTTESYAPIDLSRLAGLDLSTMEALDKAYDTLKPKATIDEIRFLNARQQALMKASRNVENLK